MESPLPENSSADLKRAIEGLIRGRELTQKLKEIIKKPLEGGVATLLAEDLIGKIMDSFSDTISVINSGDFDEVSQGVVVSPSSEKSPEDSSGSCKSSSLKDRRGCYKRRKTSETNIKESSVLVDDGHAWRKYGQKQILSSTYPRHYFRCTHKYDQMCQATKQVQKIQDNPPLFRTTYYGHHICKSFPRASQIILDSPSDNDSSSFLLSFDQNNLNRDCYVPITSIPSVKQENKEETTVFQRCTLYPSYHEYQDQTQLSSSSDYFLPANDHMTPAVFEVSGGSNMAALSYSSCTNSNDNLDLGLDFEESLWNFD